MKRFLLVLLFVPFLLSGCNFMNEEEEPFYTEVDVITRDGKVLKATPVIVNKKSDKPISIVVFCYYPEELNIEEKRCPSHETDISVIPSFDSLVNKLVVTNYSGDFEKKIDVNFINVKEINFYINENHDVIIEPIAYWR